jgi:general transcription factor 3C polypeptide 3 (transcription factor C subunit 4)
MLASISSGLRPTDAFITSTLQKHLFREMKLADAAVKAPESLRWNTLNKRYAHSGGSGASAKGDDGDVGDDDEGDGDGDGVPSTEQAAAEKSHHASTSVTEKSPIPTKHNPVIVAIYGQICIAAKSYQSAICAYIHLLLKLVAQSWF